MTLRVHTLRVVCLCLAALQGALAQQPNFPRDIRVRPIGPYDAARRAIGGEGELALARARAAFAAGQYERAFAEYRNALQSLDRSKTQEREEARNGFAESGTRLARLQIQNGRADQADSILADVLRVHPGYQPARQLRSRAAIPGEGNGQPRVLSIPPKNGTPAPPAVWGITGPRDGGPRATPPPAQPRSINREPAGGSGPPAANGQPAPPPSAIPPPRARPPAPTEEIYEGREVVSEGAPPPVATATPARKPLVKVFFGTDRAPSGERGPSKYFSANRNRGEDSLITGYVTVSIPPGHKPSQIERPWKIFVWEGREDAKKHFVLKELKRVNGDAFYDSLRSDLEDRAKASRSVFVFIHGYNVSFDEAAYRTAELTFDLNFPGVPILYSWPAQSRVLAYAGDLENAEWSASHLQSFLEKIVAQSGASRIHLVAHSMGNKVLTGALDMLAADHAEALFNNVIMAAPDVNADYFRQRWARIRPLAQRYTLYASSDDNALLTAMRLRGGDDFERLGLGGPNIIVLNGMDSVDASGIDTSLLGHSYESCKPILDDVSLLFERGLAPSERKLRDRLKNGLAYWLFP